MPLPFELALGGIAFVTVIGLFIINRSSGKLLGPRSFAEREDRMKKLQELQAIGQKLQSDPDAPDAAELRKRFAALKAGYLQDANASLAQTKAALKPMIAVNFVMAGIAALFALGAIGYLIITQGGPIFIGAGVFIVIMLGFSAQGIVRWYRGWRFATRDQDAALPDTDR